MIGTILLSVAGAWVGASMIAVWLLQRATRVLRPENPDRAPRNEALYVPAEWLVEL